MAQTSVFVPRNGHVLVQKQNRNPKRNIEKNLDDTFSAIPLRYRPLVASAGAGCDLGSETVLKTQSFLSCVK